jgi:hypothetical protein
LSGYRRGEEREKMTAMVAVVAADNFTHCLFVLTLVLSCYNLIYFVLECYIVLSHHNTNYIRVSSIIKHKYK